MTDEFLSQDELDALLKDIGTEDKKGDSLSQAIKEFFNSGKKVILYPKQSKSFLILELRLFQLSLAKRLHSISRMSKKEQ